MLEHTLGCPGTFEFRRAELATLRNEEHITDDDVVDSCVGEVLPGGALRAYLERASVAARFGSTLFVHGAVDARAGKESEIPNFKGSDLGHFPLVSANLWTSDHLSERSRSVDVVSVTRARGTLTLKRR